MVGADGTAYIEVEALQRTDTDTANSDGTCTEVGTYNEALTLVTLSPDGGSQMQQLASFSTNWMNHYSEGIYCPSCVVNPIYVTDHNPGNMIPDGQGGILASWTTQQEQPGGSIANTVVVADIGPQGGGQATFPSLNALPFGNNLVLSSTGTAFITDGSSVIAFGATSLQTLWTYTSQGGQLSLIAATADGGVAVNDSAQGVVELDPNGNATVASTGPLSNLPTPSWTASWYTRGAPGSGMGAAVVALPVVADSTTSWAFPSGDPSNRQISNVLCNCDVVSSLPPPSQTCPICQIQSAPEGNPPSCAAFAGSGPTYVLLVGDPGIIGDSGVDHNVGADFSLAAQTLANSLLSQGDQVVACRVSTVEQFTAALEENGYVTGGAQYFGHSGITSWKDGEGYHEASEIYVGQGTDTDTNITGQNVAILYDVRRSNNGQNNLGQKASVTLNGCEAGATTSVADYYAGYQTSIAQLISAALQRGVYAYIGFAHFSNDNAMNDRTNNGKKPDPSGLPMYMNADGSPSSRPTLQPFCPSGRCPVQ